MTRTLILAAGVAATLLAGCGQSLTTSAPPESSSQPPASPAESHSSAPVEGEGLSLPTWDGQKPVTFTCSSEESKGVVYTITLPPAEDGKLVTQMETLRAAVGATTKPGYLVVDIDATKATTTEGTGVYQVQWATVEQTTGTAESAFNQVATWQQGISADDTDLYNEAVDGGAKGSVLLVSAEPITSMVGPVVMPDVATAVPCELAG